MSEGERRFSCKEDAAQVHCPLDLAGDQRLVLRALDGHPHVHPPVVVVAQRRIDDGDDHLRLRGQRDRGRLDLDLEAPPGRYVPGIAPAEGRQGELLTELPEHVVHQQADEDPAAQAIVAVISPLGDVELPVSHLHQRDAERPTAEMEHDPLLACLLGAEPGR